MQSSPLVAHDTRCRRVQERRAESSQKLDLIGSLRLQLRQNCSDHWYHWAGAGSSCSKCQLAISSKTSKSFLQYTAHKRGVGRFGAPGFWRYPSIWSVLQDLRYLNQLVGWLSSLLGGFPAGWVAVRLGVWRLLLVWPVLLLGPTSYVWNSYVVTSCAWKAPVAGWESPVSRAWSHRGENRNWVRESSELSSRFFFTIPRSSMV